MMVFFLTETHHATLFDTALPGFSPAWLDFKKQSQLYRSIRVSVCALHA